MATLADFPNSPSNDQEYVAAGKAWKFNSSAWRRYTIIISDGGYADTTFNVTDDGGDASGL